VRDPAERLAEIIPVMFIKANEEPAFVEAASQF
jgi:hypothetical protein